MKTFSAVLQSLRRETARIVGMLSLCAAIPGTLAAGYPDRPVRLIVPSPPGGGTDTSTRIIAPELGEILAACRAWAPDRLLTAKPPADVE